MIVLMFRIQNIHLAGHSNRYFLNDPVPILDFRVNKRLHQVYAVDDDGCLTLYGCDSPRAYSLVPMTQYFVHDYDPLLPYRNPLDRSTNLPVEQMELGPLLDYYRAPYQFNQVGENMSNEQWLQLREQEVARNKNRMEEVAKQERLMHDQTETALRQPENVDLSDDGSEEPVEEGDNEEFRIALSEESESEEMEEEEENEEDGMYEEPIIQTRRRSVLSDTESNHSHSTRVSARTQSEVNTRSTRSANRHERHFVNDMVEVI